MTLNFFSVVVGLVVGILLTRIYGYVQHEDELSEAWRADVKRRERAMGDDTNVTIRLPFHNKLRDSSRYTARNRR
jgi:hypothetical protein